MDINETSRQLRLSLAYLSLHSIDCKEWIEEADNAWHLATVIQEWLTARGFKESQ